MRLKYLDTGEIEIEIKEISPKQFVIVRIEREKNFISLSADSEKTESKKAVITLPEGKAAQINFGRSGWGVKITMDEIVSLLTEVDPFILGNRYSLNVYICNSSRPKAKAGKVDNFDKKMGKR